MADAYATFGKFLLLKRRTQDGLGTIWRAGEMALFEPVRIVFNALESGQPYVEIVE